MNKEELGKQAEEYANNLLFVYETETVQKIVRERVRLALIDVLEQKEKKADTDRRRADKSLAKAERRTYGQGKEVGATG